ncbi:hypothetical protein [Micromonospora sp. NPDC126480]|uniref:hypothetical protein n=1 Tax=Micromonospora sp. NPDC126480 TaxID=3155312 RepID=UPI003322FE8B
MPESTSGGRERFVPPKWEKPAPLSYGVALETVSTVAAPLLAGFSLAGSVAIGQDFDKFRWPGLVVLLLVGAAVLLLSALQCGFTARRYLYSAADVRDWWPDVADDSDRERKLRDQQRHDYRRWHHWSGWTRWSYNTGLAVLLLAVAAAVAPPGGDGAQEAIRWLATGLAVSAAAVQLAWQPLTSYRRQRSGRRS